MKIIRLFLSLTIFSSCMLFGFLAGSTVGRASGIWEPASSHEMAGFPTPPPATGQHNVLLVNVDDLASQSPRLVGVWLILSIPPEAHLTLLPLYPAVLSGGEEADRYLENSFSLDADRSLAPAFITALQEMDLWWDNYIILDGSAMQELLKVSVAAGGSRSINQASLSRGLPKPWENREAALHSQSSLLTNLCRQLGGKQLHADPAALYQRISPHLQTDFQPDQILNAWSVMHKLNAPVSCEFPTLQAAIH